MGFDGSLGRVYSSPQPIRRSPSTGDNLIQFPTILVRDKQAASPMEFAGGLRAAEKLALGYFTYAVIASFVYPLSLRERLAVAGLNLAASSVILLLSKFSAGHQGKLLSTLRDWFPCVLIPLAYRESGLFFVPDPTHHFDYLLARWDSVLFSNPWVLGVFSFFSPWLQRYLEFSYLLCYPLLPLGLGSIYLARRRPSLARGSGIRADQAIDHFWTAVLLALFCCYVLFPLFPSTPPRTLFHDFPGPTVRPLLRTMNFWVLDHYGIHSSVFPSGHVAAVTAVALALRAQLPRVGVVFSIAALSVAAATVYGRYHYAADAAAGALIGVAAFFVSSRIHRSR